MNQKPRILITAGQVYGALDANKLVGNRVRGVWATRFAVWLAREGYPVTLLVPDTMGEITDPLVVGIPIERILTVVQHKGYTSYAQKCEELAPKHDVAVMAAAVVNWIPSEPHPTKMPTAGFKEGDIIQVPFVLAPRIINRMRLWNPDITLIGCKMLVGATSEELTEAAYKVLLDAHCNVVVANDMGHGLRMKHLVHQDRTVVTYDDDFNGFFHDLRAHIDDEHFRTVRCVEDTAAVLAHPRWQGEMNLFDRIVERYRSRFTIRQAGSDRVFGGLLVPTGNEGYLLSPREKGGQFTAADAAWAPKAQPFAESPVRNDIRLARGPKATLNAPLLIRMWEKWRDHPETIAVLHLHEQLPGAPTVNYAPPGTVRDNLQFLFPAPAFNIEGHGFIACLNGNLEIVRR